MKRIYSLLAAFLVLVSVTGTRAQEKWSLQKCIDYALKNNIQIKQQTLNTQYYNNQLNQAKIKFIAQPECQCAKQHEFWPKPWR